MKEYAIKDNRLFSRVYSKGKKFVGRNVVVYALSDPQSDKLERENPKKVRINRVGLTTTKKLGKAVKRVRCRRIMREGYRAAISERPLKKGYLLVFVARHSAINSKSKYLKKDFEAAFEALRLFEDQADLLSLKS